MAGDKMTPQQREEAERVFTERYPGRTPEGAPFQHFLRHDYFPDRAQAHVVGVAQHQVNSTFRGRSNKLGEHTDLTPTQQAMIWAEARERLPPITGLLNNNHQTRQAITLATAEVVSRIDKVEQLLRQAKQADEEQYPPSGRPLKERPEPVPVRQILAATKAAGMNANQLTELARTVKMKSAIVSTLRQRQQAEDREVEKQRRRAQGRGGTGTAVPKRFQESASDRERRQTRVEGGSVTEGIGRFFKKPRGD
jgi:hypothetical protein